MYIEYFIGIVHANQNGDVWSAATGLLVGGMLRTVKGHALHEKCTKTSSWNIFLFSKEHVKA